MFWTYLIFGTVVLTQGFIALRGRKVKIAVLCGISLCGAGIMSAISFGPSWELMDGIAPLEAWFEPATNWLRNLA